MVENWKRMLNPAKRSVNAGAVLGTGPFTFAADEAAATASGSGPFTLASATQGDVVRFKARPEWKWGPLGITSKTGGFPQDLTYKVVANEATAANLLITGGLDVSIVRGPDVLRLRADRTLSTCSIHSRSSARLSRRPTPAGLNVGRTQDPELVYSLAYQIGR